MRKAEEFGRAELLLVLCGQRQRQQQKANLISDSHWPRSAVGTHVRLQQFPQHHSVTPSQQKQNEVRVSAAMANSCMRGNSFIPGKISEGETNPASLRGTAVGAINPA